jgi:DNA-binding XRE family transcriptional regulator
MEPQEKRQEIYVRLIKHWLLYFQKVSPKDVYLVNDPGRRISVLRTLLGLTQIELAKRADVRQCDISRAENDYGYFQKEEYPKRREVVKKIAQAFGVTLEDLEKPAHEL